MRAIRLHLQHFGAGQRLQRQRRGQTMGHFGKPSRARDARQPKRHFCRAPCPRRWTGLKKTDLNMPEWPHNKYENYDYTSQTKGCRIPRVIQAPLLRRDRDLVPGPKPHQELASQSKFVRKKATVAQNSVIKPFDNVIFQLYQAYISIIEKFVMVKCCRFIRYFSFRPWHVPLSFSVAVLPVCVHANAALDWPMRSHRGFIVISYCWGEVCARFRMARILLHGAACPQRALRNVLSIKS